jgi:hypothetical protein
LQQLNEDRQAYIRRLDLNPADRDTAMSYVTTGLSRVIAVANQGHPELACRSLRDLKRYTSSDCDFQDRSVLQAAELSLDALVSLCPGERVTRQELHRCG